MYLVGDVGNVMPHASTPVLAYLKSKLVAESKNSSVLFLGDNIGEFGMPPAGDIAKRELAEQSILARIGNT